MLLSFESDARCRGSWCVTPCPSRGGFLHGSRTIRYELHITRAVHWADNRGHEIPAEDWLAVVQCDDELMRDPLSGEYAVLWSRKDRRVGVWFDWCEGNVYTADPDLRSLEKVLQIARLLKARVVGDDSTLFTTPDQGLPVWNMP